MEALNKTVDKLTLIGGLASSAGILAIMCLVIAEVIARNVLGASTTICDEVSGYLNAAVIFLGLGYTIRVGGLIRVELVYMRLKGKPLAVLKWINCSLALVFSSVMLLYLVRRVVYSFEMKIVSTYPTATPLFIPQGIVALGTLILVLQLAVFLIGRVRDVP